MENPVKLGLLEPGPDNDINLYQKLLAHIKEKKLNGSNLTNAFHHLTRKEFSHFIGYLATRQLKRLNYNIRGLSNRLCTQGACVRARLEYF